MRIVELTEHDHVILDRAVVQFRGIANVDHQPFLRDPGTVALVALDGDEIIGWAWGHAERHVCGYSQLMLYEIEVAGSVRRQGIGRALLAAFLNVGRRDGHAGVYLFTGESNGPAQALYRSLNGVASAENDTGFSWRFADIPRASTAPAPDHRGS